MSNEIYIAKGDSIISEGERSDALYFLVEGSAEVLKLRKGEQMKIGNIFSGELIGEISFLDGEPRSATVKAAQDCKVIEIPKENFTKILDTQPKWVKALINTLSTRLRRSNKLIKV